MPWLNRLSGVLAALLALGCLACSSEQSTPRALLIGIDGASLRVAGPLLEEGRLPHLGRIAREGVAGPLLSSLPLWSPRIWTTVATGKQPAKHGVLSFAQKLEAGGRRLYRSSDRRTHALWNIASDAGLRVAVVNWWTTHPPERIEGVMVSDHVFPEEVAELGAYMGAQAESSGERRLPAGLARPPPRASGRAGAPSRRSPIPSSRVRSFRPGSTASTSSAACVSTPPWSGWPWRSRPSCTPIS